MRGKHRKFCVRSADTAFICFRRTTSNS
jgi:hypothetical protein